MDFMDISKKRVTVRKFILTKACGKRKYIELMRFRCSKEAAA